VRLLSLLAQHATVRSSLELTHIIALARRERTPKDENVISLVLHVFRNLAYLVDRHSTSTSAAAVEDSSLQSDMVVAFQREGVLDLLLAMSSQADSNDYAPWNMVVLDILHLVYRGVRPEELMVPEGKVEQNRLRQMLDLEARQSENAFGLKGSRHSRFGTTIAVQSVRPLSLSFSSCRHCVSLPAVPDAPRRRARPAERQEVHPSQAVDARRGPREDARQDQEDQGQEAAPGGRPRPAVAASVRGDRRARADEQALRRVGLQPCVARPLSCASRSRSGLPQLRP